MTCISIETAWCVLIGAVSKLMPLTQQPSFEAVKTLYVRPSTGAGNSKTTSYIPRRVLYTEPITECRGLSRPALWERWSAGEVVGTTGKTGDVLYYNL